MTEVRYSTDDLMADVQNAIEELERNRSSGCCTITRNGESVSVPCGSAKECAYKAARVGGSGTFHPTPC